MNHNQLQVLSRCGAWYLASLMAQQNILFRRTLNSASRVLLRCGSALPSPRQEDSSFSRHLVLRNLKYPVTLRNLNLRLNSIKGKLSTLFSARRKLFLFFLLNGIVNRILDYELFVIYKRNS